MEYCNRKKRGRYGVMFLAMLICFFGLLVLNVNTGSVHISVSEIVKILFSGGGDQVTRNIIWQIRLPRILMAALLGAALSISGFLLQTFFANPIVGPYIFGISSGAKMTVALTLIFCMKYAGGASSWVLVFAAFAGAMLSVGFVLLLSKRIQSMSVLLVGGIMISYICSAITDFIVTFAEDTEIVNLHSWSLGSFSGMNWDNFYIAFCVVGTCFVITVLLSKPIGAFLMGEMYAQSMGVNIRLFRVALILLSSILAACVTAFAGPISFVGIAVPHLVKRGLNTAKPLVVIPGVFLGGAVFCMFCDLIARTVFAPTELNISTVTAVFGAPVVILMLLKRKKEDF